MSPHRPTRRKGSLVLWLTVLVAFLALTWARRRQPSAMAVSLARLQRRLRLERICDASLLWAAGIPNPDLDVTCRAGSARVHVHRLPSPAGGVVIARAEAAGASKSKASARSGSTT